MTTSISSGGSTGGAGSGESTGGGEAAGGSAGGGARSCESAGGSAGGSADGGAGKPIAVVLGTRPEIIKLAPVIRALGDRAWVIHTGQHYDANMSDAFYAGAGIVAPATVLHDVGGVGRTAQIAAMLAQVDELFAARRPAAVVVQGDTNSTNAGGQVANYHGIPLIHVEAGLRSYDRAMPEEFNRLVVGVLADLHCAATSHNVDNLLREGIPAGRIALTGNTIVEVVEQTLRDADPARLPIDPPAGRFVLATLHRPENTDDPARLRAVLGELADLDVPVVLPLHPRTAGAIDRHGLADLRARLQVIDPIDHAAFLALAGRAALLVSDSGGVQEECTVLKKPLIVVRRSTERPESIEAGFAHLVEPGPAIGRLARALLADRDLPARLGRLPSPYGDGTAAAQIATLAVRCAAGRDRDPGDMRDHKGR